MLPSAPNVENDHALPRSRSDIVASVRAELAASRIQAGQSRHNAKEATSCRLELQNRVVPVVDDKIGFVRSRPEATRVMDSGALPEHPFESASPGVEPKDSVGELAWCRGGTGHEDFVALQSGWGSRRFVRLPLKHHPSLLVYRRQNPKQQRLRG